MTKYITTEISGIITQIAKETNIPGYTEGVLECFLPDEGDEETDRWIEENNTRMKAICKFLNDNKL